MHAVQCFLFISRSQRSNLSSAGIQHLIRIHEKNGMGEVGGRVIIEIAGGGGAEVPHTGETPLQRFRGRNIEYLKKGKRILEY